MASSTPSPTSSADLSPPSDSIVMLSLPDSQDAPPQHSSGDHCAFDMGRDSKLQPEKHTRVLGDSEGKSSGGDASPVKKLKLSDHEGVGLGDSSLKDGTGKQVSESQGSVDLCESEIVPEKNEGDSGLHVMPPSWRTILEDASSGSGANQKYSVFDVLRAITDQLAAGETLDQDVDLIKVAKACGLTFPRPRWWPDHFKDP